MPYAHNSDLPSSVRNHLPEHAQDIYRATFNNAVKSHEGELHQDVTAHRIAWAAVKRLYVKDGDLWVKRP